MTRFRFSAFFAGWLILIAATSFSRAETQPDAPDFQEVFQLIRAHAVAISPAELNRAAVQGLLAELGPKAALVTGGTNQPKGAPLSRVSVFDGGLGYVRIAHVTDGLAKDLANFYSRSSSTNRLNGLVLDLRYADGEDYAAAAALADKFFTNAEPLLNWGNGMVSSEAKTNAIRLPLAILVNSGTGGSAEALAAILRSGGLGLVLGTRTAGEAFVNQTFPLKNGAELRVASAPLTLGNGTSLSTNGLKPDIEVKVNAEDERAFYADSFLVVQRTNQLASSRTSGTNQFAGISGSNGTRQRFGEAELVRQHRAGLDRDGEEPALARPVEPEKPVVSDPALARALDLLKGLAVVRQMGS
ncbi:MAG: S41 family peptidase [Verrucomicrobiota bacterium]